VDYKLLVSTSTNILDTTKYKRNIDLVGENTTTYVDTGYPANGTKYYWWVWAYAADGTYSTWAQVSANGRNFTNMPSVGAPALVSPANGASVAVMSGSANSSYPQNLAHHQDAFTFATADLQVPSGVDFAAREIYDGISMRIIRDYDINNDQFPCRIDVLGGFAALRPEFACRITG
jgi:hypothetical protein